jgi:hypothetical protein
VHALVEAADLDDPVACEIMFVWLEPRWYTGLAAPLDERREGEDHPPGHHVHGDHVERGRARARTGICMCPFMNMYMMGAIVLMPSFHPGKG